MWCRSPQAALALGLTMAAAACSSDGVADPTPLTENASGVLRTRTYYIAAETVDWDYAPSGTNLITGEPFTEEEEVFTTSDDGRIGRVYRKVLYREYTDGTFAVPRPRDPDWEHLGALGPLIRAQVGDTIRVVFRNLADRPYTMHPHGVFYDKGSEGAPYDDGEPGGVGDAVPPGATHTYVWPVPERAGPGPADGSSVFWVYHSHVDEPKDVNTGLVGPMIITARGRARRDGRPNDVDREFVTMFFIHDENDSWLVDENVARTGADPGAPTFEEGNLKHAINGYIFGNLPMLTMRQGERVRWHMLGMGNEVDLHTPHWHGQSLEFMGMRTDMVELLPGSMKVLDMQPDNPGIWLYHCHVNDHIPGGMLARFTVLPPTGRLMMADALVAWRAQVDSAMAAARR